MSKVKQNIFQINKRGINPEFSHPNTPHISKSPQYLRKSRGMIDRNKRSFDFQVSKFYKDIDNQQRRVHKSQNLRPLFQNQEELSYKNHDYNNKKTPTGKEIMQRMIKEARMKRLEENERNRRKLIQIEELRKQAEERVSYRRMMKEKELRSKTQQVQRRGDRGGERHRSGSNRRKRPLSRKLKPIKNPIVVLKNQKENEIKEEKKNKFKTIKIEAKELNKKTENINLTFLNSSSRKGNDIIIGKIERKEDPASVKKNKNFKKIDTFKSKSEKNPSVGETDKLVEEIKALTPKIASLPVTSDETKNGQNEIAETPTPPSEGQSYMSHRQSPQIYPQKKRNFKKKGIEKILDTSINNIDKRKMAKAVNEVENLVKEDNENIEKKESTHFFLSKRKKKSGISGRNVGHEEHSSYLKMFKKKKNVSKRGVVKHVKVDKEEKKIHNIVIKESYVPPPSEKEDSSKPIVKDSLLEFKKFENQVGIEGNQTPTFENLDKYEKEGVEENNQIEDKQEEKKEIEEDKEEKKLKEEISEEEVEEKKLNNEKPEEKEEGKEEEKEEEKPNNEKPEEEEEEEKELELPEEFKDNESNNSSLKEEKELEDPFDSPKGSKSSKSLEDPFGSTKKSISIDSNNNSDIKLDLNLKETPIEKIKEETKTPWNSSGEATPEIKLENYGVTTIEKDFVKKEKPAINLNNKNKGGKEKKGRNVNILASRNKKPIMRKPINNNRGNNNNNENNKVIKPLKENTVVKEVKESGILFLEQEEKPEIKGVALSYDSDEF